MAETIVIEDVKYERTLSEHPCIWMSDDRVLKIGCAHANKRNVVRDEARILKELRAAGAQCVPRVIEAGDARDGVHYEFGYMICERISGSKVEYDDHGRHSLVLDAVNELLALGCLHGDLKPDNVLYTEGRVVLIDFDQAVMTTAIKGMSIDEVLGWSAACTHELPWRQCGTLSEQLLRYGFSSNL